MIHAKIILIKKLQLLWQWFYWIFIDWLPVNMALWFFSSIVRSHNLKVSGFSYIHPLLYVPFSWITIFSPEDTISPLLFMLHFLILSLPALILKTCPDSQLKEIKECIWYIYSCWLMDRLNFSVNEF